MAEDTQNPEPETSGGKTKVIVILVATVLLFGGAGVGSTLTLAGGDKALEDVAGAGGTAEAAEQERPQADPIYVALDPPFVVNFQDKEQHSKFLKAELSVVTRQPDIEEAIAKHMPAIRNTLVLLFSRQVYDDLIPHEGKEQLRAAALAEVKNVLEEQTGDPGVEDLYFSSLVMQ